MGRGSKSRRRPSGSTSKSHKRRKKMSLEKKIEQVLMRNVETKFLDSNIPDTTPAITGTNMGSMHVVAEGINELQRIGRAITIRKIMVHLHLHIPDTTTAGNTDDLFRVRLLHFKNTAGAVAVPANVLSEGTVMDFNKLDQSHSYVTLWDEFVSMNCPGGRDTGFGRQAVFLQFYKDIDITIEYTAAAGIIGENKVNSIQLMAWTQRGIILMNGQVRIRYTDM